MFWVVDSRRGYISTPHRHASRRERKREKKKKTGKTPILAASSFALIHRFFSQTEGHATAILINRQDGESVLAMAPTDLLPDRGDIASLVTWQVAVKAVVFFLVLHFAKILYQGVRIRMKFRRMQAEGIVSLSCFFCLPASFLSWFIQLAISPDLDIAIYISRMQRAMKNKSCYLLGTNQN